MKIIYVCHDQHSVNSSIKKNRNAYIFLVGPNKVEYSGDKLIISRDLRYNIEDEPKLLTFTAWYSIIKNNLFPEEKYLCIIEWDTTLPDLENNVNLTKDVYSFFQAGGSRFICDIDVNVLFKFLRHKNMTYNDIDKSWVSTTNYIMKRDVIEKFVDFYYPDCITIIKKLDSTQLSWYHERIFWIFLVLNKFSIEPILGAEHYKLGSHQMRNIN